MHFVVFSFLSRPQIGGLSSRHIYGATKTKRARYWLDLVDFEDRVNVIDRQYDQMTQAARSGRRNIIEGSKRSATSKNTEMKLTDVARASLSELRGDYEIWILDRDKLPWSVHSPEAKAVNAVSLDSAPFGDDMVHASARHALEQREKYVRWLGLFGFSRLLRNQADLKLARFF